MKTYLNNCICTATFLVVAVLAASCEKEESSTQFYWEQTKCSDPWGTGENNTNTETILAVTKYLEDKGVSVLNVKFDNRSKLGSLCESCGCGTGKRILITVPEQDYRDIKSLNFVRES
ncbi:hypothetical protein CLV24_10733 [Pontibacter ummariensis]|uniref:Uncharacterized protein n=1 Tax=Pontibacter ummariensis TaxID=1610492 RepID=A0A239F015_9BACT|nr:hypothetical protein [Pontibacter ummariensis]PRY12662.1 hypothetical protein CLV24_10733 [Pontibacter ummariensis]SNS50177.1 hypothetical protein SAMN06296052_107155 [Pontibacter ummariensis]